MTEIGVHAGLSRERVRQRLKRNGIAGHNRSISLTGAEILDVAVKKAHVSEVAETLGMSEQSLRSRISSLGIDDAVRRLLDENRVARQESRDSAARGRIVDTIARLGRELGETPRASDLSPHGIYPVTLIRYFGSTASAMQAAGLPPRRQANRKSKRIHHQSVEDKAPEESSHVEDGDQDEDSDNREVDVSMTWYFRSPAPDESVRDPVHDEFFADDAIRDVCEAMVREGIQNALDAGAGSDGPVVVRLGVRTATPDENSEADAARRSFLTGIYDHWAAKGNGLTKPPKAADRLAWIVFEDFGTTGLTGNPSQSFPEDEANPFFAFFRAEGYSEKRSTQRGRWGLGKFAFPRASLGRCFFGLTVRHDDGRRFLMGRCTLKSHRIGTSRYTPDGFFGVRTPGAPVMPYEHPETLDRFALAFGLARDESRPGLSVVVPFVDTGEVRSAALLSAVLRGYWLAILSGDLEVRLVEEDGNVVELTTESIDEAVTRLPPAERDALLPLIALGRWGLQQPMESTVQVPPPTGLPRWGADVLPDAVLDTLREQLPNSRVKLRIEVVVRQKEPLAAMPSYFDILLERTDDGSLHKPLFIREGIIISDIRASVPIGWRSIVLVEDQPLATLLGDSENPAHTRWLKEGSHFKGRYTHGKELISYVTGSVRAILDRLTSADRDADPTVLADVLSVLLPETDGSRRRPRPAETQPTETTPPDVDVETNPRRFRLSQVEDGFAVHGAGGSIANGTVLLIRAAYDVRSGNAFTAWHELDFDLGRAPIRIIEQRNVDVLERSDNRIRLTILSNDFRFVVAGFDPWRDLKVDARLEDAGGHQ